MYHKVNAPIKKLKIILGNWQKFTKNEYNKIYYKIKLIINSLFFNSKRKNEKV